MPAVCGALLRQLQLYISAECARKISDNLPHEFQGLKRDVEPQRFIQLPRLVQALLVMLYLPRSALVRFVESTQVRLSIALRILLA